MTVLKDRPDIREVPKLERPPRPWFGWIVSLVVLVIAGGIWLIARDGTDDESPVAVPAEVSEALDSFERNELARFERLDPAGMVIASAPGGADRQDLAEAARIRAANTGETEGLDPFEVAELARFKRLEPEA